MPFDGKTNESERTRSLRAARDLISDPSRWCSGVGRTFSHDGVKRCAVTAAGDARCFEHAGMFDLLTKHSAYPQDRIRALPRTNDDFGHARVMQMFDDAIAESVALDIGGSR
jgi:hypothetical protein